MSAHPSQITASQITAYQTAEREHKLKELRPLYWREELTIFVISFWEWHISQHGAEKELDIDGLKSWIVRAIIDRTWKLNEAWDAYLKEGQRGSVKDAAMRGFYATALELARNSWQCDVDWFRAELEDKLPTQQAHIRHVFSRWVQNVPPVIFRARSYCSLCGNEHGHGYRYIYYDPKTKGPRCGGCGSEGDGKIWCYGIFRPGYLAKVATDNGFDLNHSMPEARMQARSRTHALAGEKCDEVKKTYAYFVRYMHNEGEPVAKGISDHKEKLEEEMRDMGMFPLKTDGQDEQKLLEGHYSRLDEEMARGAW